jgi:hypothetical protein
VTQQASSLGPAFASEFLLFRRKLEEFMGQNGRNQSTPQYMALPENSLPADFIVNHSISMYFPQNVPSTSIRHDATAVKNPEIPGHSCGWCEARDY